MRRGRVVLIIGLICLLAILTNGYIVYGSVSNRDNLEKHKSIIEELLNQRVSLMNEGIYNSADINELRERLASIESGELLKADIEVIEYIQLNPTEIDYVQGVSVETIEEVSEGNGHSIFTVLIEWDILNNTEQVKETYWYDLELIKANEKYYLNILNLKGE